MKIFSPQLIKEIDQYTIINEPISDWALMERASSRIVQWIEQKSEIRGNVFVFVGPGNNGGDGLAIARLLTSFKNRFEVSVFVCNPKNKFTTSSRKNLDKWISIHEKDTVFLDDQSVLPDMQNAEVVIDALFGAGLNRPLKGWWAELTDHINKCKASVISVDFPSGLLGGNNEENSYRGIVQANYTLTFQFPKLSLLFAENEQFVGDLCILDIGLHNEILKQLPSTYYFLEQTTVAGLLKRRPTFSHKGTFGHAILYVGSYGKMGAAVLAAQACLKSGVGLLTVHVPSKGYEIIQIAVPEAMAEVDDSEYFITSPKIKTDYSAIGIGPGIGQKLNTARALERLILESSKPMVIDADGLNILSCNPEWFKKLPENSILTPHPKEFERMAGKTNSDYLQLHLLKEMSQKWGVFIVLKGAYTKIASPDGKVYFNSTGNSGMATGGSGDVLTGMITALLAQGYSSLTACLIGVFLHGRAGDLAAEQIGYESLIASDITNKIGAAFKSIV